MLKTAKNILHKLDCSLCQEISELDANTIVGGHSGRELLAHELTHGGQQISSVAPSQTKVIVLMFNSPGELERIK